MRVSPVVFILAFVPSVANATDDMSVGNMFSCWNLASIKLEKDKTLLCRGDDEVIAWVFAACARDEADLIQQLGGTDDGAVNDPQMMERAKETVEGVKQARARDLTEKLEGFRRKLCTP